MNDIYIGNPYSLLNEVGKGMYDLLEKPVSGFSKGPLSGLEGIFLGTSSLIGKTTSGTLNSVNKISSSLGDQVSRLSFDKSY